MSKNRRSGGTPAVERRALLLLKEMDLIPVYSSNDKVVLECGHIQVLDSVLRRGGKYHSLCTPCNEWKTVSRKAQVSDSISRVNEENELW